MSKYMQVLTKVCVIEHRLQRLLSEVQASRRRARRLNEMAPIELQAFSVNLRSLMQGCYRKTTQNEHRCSCEVLSLQCPGAMRYFFKILRPPLLTLRRSKILRPPLLTTSGPSQRPRASQSVPRASPERPRASPERPRASESVPRASQSIPRASLERPQSVSERPQSIPRGSPGVSREAFREARRHSGDVLGTHRDALRMLWDALGTLSDAVDALSAKTS